MCRRECEQTEGDASSSTHQRPTQRRERIAVREILVSSQEDLKWSNQDLVWRESALVNKANFTFVIVTSWVSEMQHSMNNRLWAWSRLPSVIIMITINGVSGSSSNAATRPCNGRARHAVTAVALALLVLTTVQVPSIHALLFSIIKKNVDGCLRLQQLPRTATVGI